MYKRLSLLIFLGVFLALVLLPVLLRHGETAAAPISDLNTPEIERMAQAECIEQSAYMRSEHMHLLESWRTEVVRNGATLYTSSSGQVYEMSLEATCFSCHSNRNAFCASCHEYVAVEPQCWSCHEGADAGGTQ
jgi:hypothetical protein